MNGVEVVVSGVCPRVAVRLGAAGRMLVLLSLCGLAGCDTDPASTDAGGHPDAMAGDSGPVDEDAGGPADGGPWVPTAQPVIVIANAVSGLCSATELRTTLRPIIDGTPDAFGGIGAGALYVPAGGATHVQLEYDVFGCDDMFYDQTIPLASGARLLLGASGPRGAEVVTMVDLAGRWDASPDEMLVVHLSPTAGHLAYQVDGPGGVEDGELDFGEVDVVPIGRGSNTVRVTTPSLEDSINWPGAFSDSAANLVLCVVRDTPTGEQALDCTGGGVG